MVAAVPMTPIRPFRVARAAASAADSTTPMAGKGSSAKTWGAVELTVPQAAMIIFTSIPMRKRQSCRAYLAMISLLRLP